MFGASTSTVSESPIDENPIAESRTTEDSKANQKRRSSSVSKAKDIIASARHSFHFGRDSTETFSVKEEKAGSMQKLSKEDPALSVPQGPHNNSAGPSLPGPHSTFKVGVTEDKNKKCRRTMEDTHAYLYNFLSTPKAEQQPSSKDDAEDSKVADTDNGYFAIFDGHAGTFAADWCGKKLHLLLEEIIRKHPNTPIPELLDQTFTSVDQQLEKLPLKNSGCTAVTAVLRWEDRVPNPASATGSAYINHAAATKVDSESEAKLHATEAKLRPVATRQRVLYTANVGDARIVLCRSGRALRLSYDHKGSDESEGRRISNAGGLILNNRVNGVLAVTRALGDSYMKELITGHPYTTETVIQPDQDEFLILACDGLWDVCTDQEAVDLIRQVSDPQAASKALVDHALGRFSTDNLSCMVVRFDNEGLKARKTDASIGVEGDEETKGALSEADHIVEEAKKHQGDLNDAQVDDGNDDGNKAAKESAAGQADIKLNSEAAKAADVILASNTSPSAPEAGADLEQINDLTSGTPAGTTALASGSDSGSGSGSRSGSVSGSGSASNSGAHIAASAAATPAGFVAPSSYLRIHPDRHGSVPVPARTELTLTDKEELEALKGIRKVLKQRTSNDVLPLSYRLVLVDSGLTIKASLGVLAQMGIVSAPMWDSRTSTFCGMITANDYINVVQYYLQHPQKVAEIEKMRLRNLSDIERAIGVTPVETLSIHPDRPLYEALRKMLQSRARRIPLVDIDDETQRPVVISVITQYRILRFISTNIRETAYLKKTLKELKSVGTYTNLVSIRMNTPVIDAIHLLVKFDISSIPIVDENNKVENVFEAVDVISLIQHGGNDYENLHRPVGEALLKRSDDFRGIHTCTINDRLGAIFDTIRRSPVHRFIVIDSHGTLKGVLTLSDILKYILLEGKTEDEDENPGGPTTVYG